MGPEYYCEAKQAELIGLKARIYGILREIDRMNDEERESLSSAVSELYSLVDDYSDRLGRLKIERPANWIEAREQIEATRQELIERVDTFDREHLLVG